MRTVESAFVALFVAIQVMICVVNLRRSRSSARLEGKAARIAGKVGLQLSADVMPMVVDTARRTWVAEGVGGAGGSIAAALVALALPDATPEGVITLIVLAGAFSGTTIGSGIVAAVTAWPGLLDGSRFARGRMVRVRDYLSPIERVAPWAAAGLSLTSCALVAVTSRLATPIGVPLVVSFGSVLVVVLAELTMRAIVRQPQRASTPTVLAWSDALRSVALRQMSGSAAYLAFWSMYITLPLFLPRTTDLLSRSQRDVVATVSPFVGFGLLGGVVVLAIVDNGAQRYLRRLWPDVDGARRQMRPSVVTE